jgi:AraC family ethanolamine operon transcriptional activator
MARLRALHHRIMSLVPITPDQRTHSEVARAADQALLTAVIDCLVVDSDDDVQALGWRNSTVLMRRLYKLLDESERLPLYPVDVCAQLGVTARTLHRVCAEHVGLSPRRFLWLRRMQLARQALIVANLGTATVTGIATDLGFWELGRFAGRYKWLFGESPSATLSRRHF